MSGSSNVFNNGQKAHKLVTKSLKYLSRFLVSVGRPLYLLVSYSLILTLFGFSVLSHIFTFLSNTLDELSENIPGFLDSIFEFIDTFIGTFFHLLFKLLAVFLRLTIWITAAVICPLKFFFSRKPTPTKKVTHKGLRISKRFLVISALTLFTLSTLATIFWLVILKDLPKPSDLKERSIDVSTKIYDRNGILLYNIYKDQNRTPVKLDDIPIHVRLATLAIEDAEFYSHPGFSVKGIARALIENAREGELSGGSTITQQLVKNALLSSEKTYVRKLRELILAIQVEINYEKEEILEMYLNEVAYGGTAYGIQEAARMYFDKDIKKLTLGEAAILAGLPKSPTKYSPFGSNPQNATGRQKEVLHLMRVNGYINEDQEKDALDEKIEFAQNKIDIKAPHFVMFIRETLEDKYGKELVGKGGLEVVTTLDYQIQKLAEEIVSSEVEKLKNLNVTNGAVIVLNPQTGEILAMVGSRNYFDTAGDGNVNVVTSLRQPGSSIKIVNYTYALENGYTPASIIDDSAVTFLVDGQPPYTPKNYEGEFRGKLSLRSALAESRNIPAVKVLASYGVEQMMKQGVEMGISTWKKPSDYGLSLTLGGGDVKLIDLATSYAVVANYGKKPKLASILKITNHKGKVIEEFDCNGDVQKPLIAIASSTKSAVNINFLDSSDCKQEQVVDPRVAYLITDILKDNQARSPAFGTNSLLNIEGHPEVAVKTGTSNNLRDNLAIGYTQNYVVATWVGNNDNSQMSRIASGVTGATPVFNKIMSALLAEKENNDWEIPNGLVQLEVCPYTGTLGCNGCPTKLEWFLEENTPPEKCNPEWFKKLKVDQVGQIEQVVQENSGKILPEAAKIEVVDLRKSY